MRCDAKSYWSQEDELLNWLPHGSRKWSKRANRRRRRNAEPLTTEPPEVPCFSRWPTNSLQRIQRQQRTSSSRVCATAYLLISKTRSFAFNRKTWHWQKKCFAPHSRA